MSRRVPVPIITVVAILHWDEITSGHPTVIVMTVE